MKLVAVVRTPPQPEDGAHAVASAAGLALAEARMRLAPEPPALLARLEDDRAGALVAALRAAGLAALAVDARVPTDHDRMLARAVALDAGGATFTARSGEAVRVEWPEVRTLLRGVRAARLEVERTEQTRRFSPGTALLTGGLVLSRARTQTVRSAGEQSEQVVLVYARDGRVIALAESQVDFGCLGAGMQASATANMLELWRRLRERAKDAFQDERLVRLGRRPLPLVVGGESRAQTATTTTTRVDTGASFDVLAEVLWQAVEQGLLP